MVFDRTLFNRLPQHKLVRFPHSVFPPPYAKIGTSVEGEK